MSSAGKTSSTIASTPNALTYFRAGHHRRRILHDVLLRNAARELGKEKE